MNEDWVRWVAATLLGWIAYELRGMRRDVSHKVSHAECDRRMGEHNEKINENKEQIEAHDRRIRVHGWKIASLETIHNKNKPLREESEGED